MLPTLEDLKIKICTCTYDRPNLIANAVRSIAKQGYDITYKIFISGSPCSTVIHMNEIVAEKDYDIIFWLADDIELDEDCIKNILIAFSEKFPDLDGVVGINQKNIPDGCKSAFPAIGKKFVERFGDNPFFCPNYYHFFVDSELHEYANSVGKFHFCKEAKLYHHHPACSERNVDNTHKIVRQNAAKDFDISFRRKELGLVWGNSFKLI